MLRVLFSLILCLLFISNLYASQSTIIESEGYACMGEDKSMKADRTCCNGRCKG